MAGVIFKSVLIAVALCSLGAVLHYAISAIVRPKYFLEFAHDLAGSSIRRSLPIKAKIYFGFTYLGAAVIAFGGFRLLLFWIPDSWGTVTDGTFQPVRDMIAGVLAILSLGLVSYLEKSALASLANEELRNKMERLHIELVNSRSVAQQGAPEDVFKATRL